MSPEPSHLRQFLLLVFALLLPCFALWAASGGALEKPAVGLVHLALTHWFPTVVEGLFVNGAETLLMTAFGEAGGAVVPLAEAEHQLGFRVNPRILSYSLPFYTALYFATPRTDYLAGYLWGLFILYALLVFGLLCLCLKQLMVNLGALFLEQQGVFVPPANVIAMFYQFNVLMVPTLAPAMLWLWQGRDSPLLQGVLPMRREIPHV